MPEEKSNKRIFFYKLKNVTSIEIRSDFAILLSIPSLCEKLTFRAKLCQMSRFTVMVRTYDGRLHDFTNKIEYLAPFHFCPLKIVQDDDMIDACPG